jgi:hypothetical protein
MFLKTDSQLNQPLPMSSQQSPAAPCFPPGKVAGFSQAIGFQVIQSSLKYPHAGIKQAFGVIVRVSFNYGPPKGIRSISKPKIVARALPFSNFIHFP